MIAVILSALTFASTLAGGLAALKGRRWLNLLLGWTAGVILGLIAFDILPEIFSVVRDTGLESVYPMVALVGGFLLFHVLEKSILMHHAHEGEYGSHHHPHVGLASALALAGHSFLDGVAIGIGFQAGHSVGIAVAVAVIAHDFSDGLNTVNLMLSHKNTSRRSLQLLLVDALAPVLGAASTLLYSLPAKGVAIYLGFFAGFLLYIGASDILPQAHSKGSSRSTIGLTILGAAFMYAVTLAA